MSDNSWRAREQAKFDSGEYSRLPWSDETWWVASDAARDHYAHPSQEDPSKIAYTEDARKGAADRQTRVKPGRYLNRYFSDVLSPTDIQYWAGKFAGANESHTLRFATTPDEIEEVYTRGPDSCMSHSPGSYDSPEHPTRVYGAGDLAIAYIAPVDHPTARTLCWPDRKVYSRIYGDADRLLPLLDAAGFHRDSGSEFNGARMLAIDAGPGYIAPYLDGGYGASLEGQFLIMSDSADMECGETNGLTVSGFYCDRCNETETGESYTVDGRTWCEYCYENNAAMCEHCEELTDCDNTVSVGHSLYCEYCARENCSSCTRCDTVVHDNETTTVDGDTWCEGCAEHYASYCEACSETTASETREVWRGGSSENWCEGCVNEEAQVCDSCGDFAYFRELEAHIAAGAVCPDCIGDARAELLSDMIGDPPSMLLLPARAASSRAPEHRIPARMGRPVLLLPARAASLADPLARILRRLRRAA